MKKFKITVNGKAYEVVAEVIEEIQPKQTSVATTVRVETTAAPFAGGTKAPVATSGAGAIPSPLAGKVVSVEVKVGDSVTEGQKLLTLEAMKMNTFVNATKAGVVKEICVTTGQAVAEGAALLRVE